MEPYTIKDDIEVFYVLATSFPEGIAPAFEKLRTLLPDSKHRKFYGISRPEGGNGIVYKAAVAANSPGEGAQYGCDNFIIRKGVFLSELVKNYQEDISAVSQTFDKLLAAPDLDPQGYCLEEYINGKDIRCMVPVLR